MTQNKLGIIISSIVVFAVVLVTAVFSRKPAAVQVANNFVATAQQTPVQAPVPVSSGEREDSSEDGGVPVVPPTPPADTSKQTVPASTAVSAIYKDGVYSATGSYMSPGGQDQIAVTLTLKGGVITNASVVPTSGDRTSARYEARFVSGYKQYVIGQKISDVYLTNVSGSSLTPIGFNNALTQIKAQAKA